MEIDINNIKQLLLDHKKERAELGKIIYPIIEKYNLPEKELLEVCQIGKFVYKIDSEIRITEKPEPPNPDFIIEYNTKLIGLEHTRIFTDNAENYNRITTLLSYSEKIYCSKYPGEKLHAIISIQDDKLEYKQSEKKRLGEEIANYIYNYNKGIEINRPSYISSIRTTIHSKLSFTYKEKNWEGPYLTKERLDIDIQKKEQKIEIYKRGEKELSEYWLVLLIGSLNSSSYRINENENYETKSAFDRVYLMTDFDAEIIRVK